jgi:hypothetical protein
VQREKYFTPIGTLAAKIIHSSLLSAPARKIVHRLRALAMNAE